MRPIATIGTALLAGAPLVAPAGTGRKGGEQAAMTPARTLQTRWTVRRGDRPIPIARTFALPINRLHETR